MMVEIRSMRAADGPAVLAIYGGGIATGHASFQETVPAWEEWDAGHLECCRLVAEQGGEVVGWAALSPVSSRKVYAGVGEVSIYLADGMRGRGVGDRLLGALIESSESRRPLDASGRHFPGERRQHRPSTANSASAWSASANASAA